MHNNPLVSIVIPAFNVEQYIDKCINSVVNQSYKNLEIIIVNDGSTDKTGDVIEKWAKKDSRIIRINKENGGLSSARNEGIRIASGEYISFVDSDDWISECFIRTLLESCKKNMSDISICNMSYVFDNGEQRKRTPEIKNEEIVDGLTAFKDMLNGRKFKCHAVNKLYKRNLFLEHGIFYPDGKLYEDVFTTYKLICSAENISYVPQNMYFYLQNRTGSILSSAFNEKRMVVFDALSEIDHYIEGNTIDAKDNFIFFAAENIISLVNYISPIYSSIEKKKRVVQKIKGTIDKYRLTKCKNLLILGKTYYARILLMRMNFGVYTRSYVLAKKISAIN